MLVVSVSVSEKWNGADAPFLLLGADHTDFFPMTRGIFFIATFLGG